MSNTPERDDWNECPRCTRYVRIFSKHGSVSHPNGKCDMTDEQVDRFISEFKARHRMTRQDPDPATGPNMKDVGGPFG